MVESAVIQAIISAVDNFSKTFAALENAQNTAIKGFATMGTKAVALGNSMQAIGNQATQAGLAISAAIAPIGLALGAAVSSGIDFEAAMKGVQAVANATDEQFQQLSDTARKLGETTAFTASQAAEGMQYLAMAGFEVNDIIEAMPGLLATASAGAIDLGSTADIVSNILTGFRLTAEDTGRVADVLTKTFTSSNVTLYDLGDAMKYAAPIAASFGLTIEEMSAAMGMFGDAGLQGSIAGRAFATSLTRLAAPTSEMKSLMEDLNLDFFDSNGQLKSLAEILNTLETAFKGFTDEQKAAAISTLFGAEAQKNWQILLAQGSDELINFTTELENSLGTAEKVATTRIDSISGSITLLNSKLQDIAIDVFEQLKPQIESFFVVFESAIPTIKSLANAFALELANAITKIGTVLNNVRKTVIQLTNRIKILAIELSEPFGQVAQRDFLKYIDSLDEMAVKFAAVGTIAATVLGPLLLISGPIISAIGGIISSIGSLAIAVSGFVEGPLFAPVLAAIALVAIGIGALYNAFQTNFRDIQGTFANLVANLSGAFDRIKTIFATVIAIALDLFTRITENQSVQTFFVVLIETVNMLVSSFNQLYDAFAEAIGGIDQDTLNQVIAIFGRLGEVLINMGVYQLQMMAQGFQNFIDIILKLIPYVDDLINVILDVIIAIDDLYNYIVGTAENLYNAGVSMMQSLADGILAGLSYVETAINKVTAMVDSYLPHSPAEVGPLSTLDQSGPGLVRTLADGITGSSNILEDAINSLASGMSLNLGNIGAGIGTTSNISTTNNDNSKEISASVIINNPSTSDILSARRDANKVANSLLYYGL